MDYVEHIREHNLILVDRWTFEIVRARILMETWHSVFACRIYKCHKDQRSLCRNGISCAAGLLQQDEAYPMNSPATRLPLPRD